MNQVHKSYQQKTQEVKRNWHLIDADKKVLGRLASEAARLLMGKHKATYSPQTDGGDYVVVINSQTVAVTGRKEEDKTYYSHSGYPGGLKQKKLWELREQNPNKIIELAVRRMLPDNRLRAPRMARLKVYPEAEHPYSSKIKA